MDAPKDRATALRHLSFWLLVWALLTVALRYAQAQPRRNPATQASTVAWLVARLGASESAGPNRGPLVDPLIRAGGGQPGQEWCGFTQAADQRAHGLPIPGGGLQGGARYWFMDAACKYYLPRSYYVAGQRGSLDSIQPGDLCGFAWRPSVIVHHITRFAEVVPALRKGRPPRGFYTLGGNEGKGTAAGLHRTFYAATSITAAARWDYK